MNRITSFFRDGVVFEWSIVAIAFLLPLFSKPLALAIIASTLFWLIKESLFIRVRDAFRSKLFVVIILFFLVHLVSYFFSKDKQVAGFDLEEKLSLLIFPLLFWGSGGFRYIKSEWIEKSFIIGVLSAVAVCSIVAFSKSFNNPYTNGEFSISIWSDTIDKPWWWLLTSGYSFFNYDLYSFFLHPSYFALYLTFASFLVVNKNQSGLFLFKNRTIRLTILFILIINILLLQSRTGFLGLFVLLVWILVKSSRTLRRKVVFAGAILVITLIVLLTGRFETVTSKIATSDWSSIKQTNIRISIWRETLSLIAEKPIFGYTIGDAKAVLVENYNDSNLLVAKETRLNTHNEFLETTLKLGLIGLIVLLAMLFYPVLVKCHNREVYLFFILIFIIHLLFESMFERFAGICFFSFFYSFINYNLTYDTIFTTKDR